MPPSGGYRKPSGGARVSGVGAASQRSDANQPVNVGRLFDAEDLKHGDMQKLKKAVEQVPIGRASSPRLSAAALPSSLPMGGAAAYGDPTELGEHIFATPTTRPTEPPTEGFPFGPGGGPEVLATNKVATEKMELIEWIRRRPNASADWDGVRASVVNELRPPDPVTPPLGLSSAEPIDAGPQDLLSPENTPTSSEDLAPEDQGPPMEPNVPEEVEADVIA